MQQLLHIQNLYLQQEPEASICMTQSITSSQIFRVLTYTKKQLQSQHEMKKINQLRQKYKERRKIIDENLIRQGKKKKDQKQDQTKVNVDRVVNLFKDFRYHLMTKQELQQQLDTNLNTGLTQAQALQRQKKYGENVLEEIKSKHWALVFLQQMSDLFSLFVWSVVVLAFIGYFLLNDSNQLVLSIILIITMISGAIISYGFVRSSDEEIKQFKRLLPRFSNVVREGKFLVVDSSKLVPGDVVFFSPGDLVPADIRIIKSIGMRIDNSSFTGESKPFKVEVQEQNDMIELMQQKNSFGSKNFSEQQINLGFQKMTSIKEIAPGKQKKKSQSETINPVTARNMAFSGSICVQGQGHGVVIRTGERMLIANIRQVVMSSSQTKQSSLQPQINRFVKIVTLFSIGVFLYTLIVGYLVGYPIVIAANMAMGVFCASCPGVLNLQLTCMLYISVRRLFRKKLICKTLECVESLGSTQILCTDKTGTLTTNQMTLQKIFYNEAIYTATNAEDHPYSQLTYDIDDATFKMLNKCAVLSSVADFNRSMPKNSYTNISSRRDIMAEEKQRRIKAQEKQWQRKYETLKTSQRQVTGDSTESALIRFFQPIQDIKQTRKQNKITYKKNTDSQNRLLFKASRKYSMSINYSQDRKQILAYFKGSPDVIWRMCNSILIRGQRVPITKQLEAKHRAVVEQWGSQGKRVLSFCYVKIREATEKKLEQQIQAYMEERTSLRGMTFLGSVSMQDPPRSGVIETIDKIKRAGIKVILITGDQESTAVSIARQCNILTFEKTTTQLMKQQQIQFQQALSDCQNVVVNGDILQETIDQDNLKTLKRILEKPNIVFSNASPQQKLYIVQRLQKLSYIVTLVGDGLNDSSAIKIANTGISMQSGTQASREAADIILGNDDFYNIITGIQQGRILFDNFKKAICYVMTSQVSQWMPFIFIMMTRIPIPIFTLLVDGAPDFVPVLAFAYQEAEDGVMTRPPKYRKQQLLNFRLVAQCQGWMGFSSFLACLFSYYIVMVDFGFVPSDLWGRNNDLILLQNRNDMYNPTNKFLGNSNLQKITSCAQFHSLRVKVDWLNTTYPYTDLRMSAVRCIEHSSGNIQFIPTFQFGPCLVQQISILTFKPICYTPEATKYAQSSYMFANVINQLFNWIICRTRRDSAVLKPFNNSIFVFGIAVQALMGFSLAYTYPWFWIIGTRDVIFEHFGLCAIPFCVLQLVCDEGRKWLIRTRPRGSDGKANWWQRNTLW